MNIRVVANVLQFIPTIGKLWANSIINRRKQTQVFCVFCALQSIVYGLLGAYRGMVSAFYFALKNLYLLVFHKEEKIVIKPIECLLLGLPLIIIGIAGYVGGGLFINIFVGIADFTDANIYVIKNEILRFSIQIICVIIWGIYMFQVGNFVGVAEEIIIVIIFVINIIRLIMNGEKKYYNCQSF